MSGRSAVVTCCGSGRELGMLHKYGIKLTATDLTIEQLSDFVRDKIVERAEIQNAERLSYADDSFDYGFVYAGLHHLAHPHAGLCELMRTGREAAIFIEPQDSLLHAITRMLGRTGPDFEPAGNYVYRWKRREVEKIAMSAHAHSFAVKTYFLPVLMFMRDITGWKKKLFQFGFDVANLVLSRTGNLFICMIFKRPPTSEQIVYLKKAGYSYVPLSHRYPDL